MKRIYLIDSPGVVAPDRNASPEDFLLRGVVRTEKVDNPAQYIQGLQARTKKQHISRTYDIQDRDDANHLLDLLARTRGRILPAGELDRDSVARTCKFWNLVTLVLAQAQETCFQVKLLAYQIVCR